MTKADLKNNLGKIAQSGGRNERSPERPRTRITHGRRSFAGTNEHAFLTAVYRAFTGTVEHAIITAVCRAFTGTDRPTC